MSVEHYHQLCTRYKGRAVEIETRDGNIHRGFIHDVDRNRVFIRPLGGNRNLGGFSYGFGGFGGYRGFGGFGYGIALGAIIGLALLPLIFW